MEMSKQQVQAAQQRTTTSQRSMAGKDLENGQTAQPAQLNSGSQASGAQTQSLTKQSFANAAATYDNPGYRRLVISLLIVLFVWQIVLLGIASATLDRINSIRDMISNKLELVESRSNG